MRDPFSTALLEKYADRFPGSAMLTAGSACSSLYRGLKLWESAVNEVGSLDQDRVVRALDRARIDQGPAVPQKWCRGSTTCA